MCRYTFNGVTDIEVIEEDGDYWVVELAGERPLKARILKQDIIDGEVIGTITKKVEATED